MWNFKRRPSVAIPRPSTPHGVTIYAVGDVHGRLDLLQRLTETISRDAADLPKTERRLLVLLGDYVDRGPESAGVIEHIIGLGESSAFELHALKGNHEDALLTFLEDPAIGPVWAPYGAMATIQSYTGRGLGPTSAEGFWESAREALVEAMPERHLTFLRGLELSLVSGDYCFVHAGIRPGVPLADQDPVDLLTIRGEFLSAKGPFEKVIVYGHTPSLEPVIERDRIGVDTGAYATGVLTCLRLAGEGSSVIQVRS